MLVMFEHSEKRIVDRFKMDAAIHGVKLEDEPKQASQPAQQVRGGISGDPDSYSHLSMEEREKLTQEMMGRHKAWVKTDMPLPTDTQRRNPRSKG
jgi:hypothetical protein